MPSHVSLLLIVAALGVCAYGAERRTEFPFGGKWITAQSGQGNYRPALRLSREFVVEKPVKRAVLGATALGLYVPYVNGREITARRMMPGWTQYERRVPSQEFDVTEFLRPGTNVVSALVGDGWYCSQISYVAAAFAQHEGRTGWGRHPRFRAELRIEYSDGAVETNSTDRTWKSFYMDPATLANDIYQGEEYDAEIEDEKWKLPGCSRLWTANGVREVEESAEIVGDIGQPVVVTRELKPVKIERRPSGAYILDFGENIAGVDRIRLAKPHPGAVIVVRHGEDLDRNGNLWRGNLAFAGAKTVLTCGPKAPFEYSPRFTFFGYRYAEVSGWPADEELTPDSVNALVLSAAVRETGSFECSNELLDRLYANVRRSQQANFIDVPTDCPQRCERFGWTGDAQIFAETAMMNYDVRRFFVKWMGDVRLCAGTSGAFPDIAPWPDQGFDTSKSTGSAGWADVGVVVPWMLYRKYGDCDALREAYPSIVKYVDLIASAEKLGTIGDHLNLDQPTSTAYLAEALRIEMHRLAALAARALGETEDAKRFAARREQLLARFRAKHLGADGLPKERTQTAAAFSIVYGIAPDDAARRATVGLLKELIAERDGHLATGFLGAPVLLRALTEAGEIKTAYKLLETTTFPSWLYPVTQGATTIWERWNAKVDGKFNSDWMNSLNHYAYGSVVAWFYDTIVGIRDLTEENPEWAGFKRFRLAPQPGGTLTYAKATHEIPGGGVISSAWELKDGHVEWVFEVPEGSEAEVVLPGKLLNALPKGIAIKENLLLAKSGQYALVCEKAGETLTDHIRANWQKTVRFNRTDEGTKIGLPFKYTVPCMADKFQEMYYWDTYFTNVGLILSGLTEQARDNVGNIAYLIEKFGYMPNGNRTYYLSRSQPPFFTRMVSEVYDAKPDKSWLAKMYAAAVKEHAFWQTQRLTASGLNRYSGSFRDDAQRKAIVEEFIPRAGWKMPTDPQEIRRMSEIFISYAESGWDCTSRFGWNPQENDWVDLNSLLYGTERDLERFAGILGNGEEAKWRTAAENRRALMNRVMWDERLGMFCDHDFVKDARSPFVSAAAFYPLFVGLATPEQAKRTVALLPRIECAFGVAASQKDGIKDLQWDYPHGWACLQYVVVQGLLRYGYEKDARRIANKYSQMVERVFAETGSLWEKYDVTTGKVSVSREYETPKMLGWSAGVYLAFLNLQVQVW